jgi:hypothetical protein
VLNRIPLEWVGTGLRFRVSYVHCGSARHWCIHGFPLVCTEWLPSLPQLLVVQNPEGMRGWYVLQVQIVFLIFGSQSGSGRRLHRWGGQGCCFSRRWLWTARGVWTRCYVGCSGDGWALYWGFCWARFIVALQVSDFRSCVLCCNQFSLNILVQSPESRGNQGVICVADDGGDIWQLVGLLN